jgi:hypothetical protein
MTDKDRLNCATRQGSKMLGPIERQRCQHHPRRWVTYRWTWPVDSSPMVAGESSCVRSCGSCADEETKKCQCT